MQYDSIGMNFGLITFLHLPQRICQAYESMPKNDLDFLGILTTNGNKLYDSV